VFEKIRHIDFRIFRILHGCKRIGELVWFWSSKGAVMEKKGIAAGKNILVFYSSVNAPGRQDATGAFVPEATAFATLHLIPKSNLIGMDCRGISVSKEARRSHVMETISHSGIKWDGIFFFGHGWPDGIQFGFNRVHIPDLASVIAQNSTIDARVGLYACLAAENDMRDQDYDGVGPGTDGGFADVLRDELVRHGLALGHVDAHKTAGHTSWNPFVIRFLCEDVDHPEYGAEGGAWIIAPRTKLWRKWVEALKVNNQSLRHRFPFMDEAEIRDELAVA
jgi:hypothetical protein